MQRKSLIALILSLLLFAAACGNGDEPVAEPDAPDAPDAPEEPDAPDDEAADVGSLRVAVGAPISIEFAATFIADERGFYSDRGLTVENLAVRGGGEVARTMAAGEADIGLTGGPGAVSPILKGFDGKLIAATSLDFVGLVIIAAADGDVQEAEDLEGKTIGFTSHGSLTDFASRKIAEHFGWEIGTDVQTASIGGVTELMAALRAGSIDAFTFSPEPGFQLEEEGEARVVGDLGEIVGPNVFEAAYASTDVIENRPEAVEAFFAGYFEAVQWMKDNREEAIAWMANEWEMSEFAVERTYDISIDNLSVTGEIPEENLEGLAQSVPDLDEDIDEPPAITDFWDDRFVPVTS